MTNIEIFVNRISDMQIPFYKIASEDFSAFMRMLSLFKLLKKPTICRVELVHRLRIARLAENTDGQEKSNSRQHKIFLQTSLYIYAQIENANNLTK